MSRLDRSIQETILLGNNINLPMMCLSYGDFLAHHGFNAELARGTYRRAQEFAELQGCAVMPRLAEKRLHKLGQ